MIRTLYSIVIALLFSSLVQASELSVVGDFSEQAHDGKLPEYWEVLTFDGIERYSSYRHMRSGVSKR